MYMNDQAGGDDWVGGYWFQVIGSTAPLIDDSICCTVASS